MNRESSARLFFDELVTSENLFGVAAQWISGTPAMTENEWRDFKGASKVPLEKAKEIWSKSLSAFANTQGGVLVWGLECRKIGDPPIDQVCGFDLVSDPQSFASRLMELHHQATEPPVLGIEVLPVCSPGDISKGLVICYVPESAAKPCRAEHAQKQYFIRAGDDTVVPSVPLLRHLFVPSSNAFLKPSISAFLKEESVYGGTITRLYFNCHVTNIGLVSSEGALLTLHGQFSGDFFQPQGWRKLDTAVSRIAFESPRRIFPGEPTQVFTFTYGTPIRSLENKAYNFPSDFRQDFELRIYSHNQEPIVAKVSFSENDIVHQTPKECTVETIRS